MTRGLKIRVSVVQIRLRAPFIPSTAGLSYCYMTGSLRSPWLFAFPCSARLSLTSEFEHDEPSVPQGSEGEEVGWAWRKRLLGLLSCGSRAGCLLDLRAQKGRRGRRSHLVLLGFSSFFVSAYLAFGHEKNPLDVRFVSVAVEPQLHAGVQGCPTGPASGRGAAGL